MCASFYFGTTHVLLGKTVAMGGCNLKMKKSWGGWGGGRSASPPDAGSHALFTPMSLHEYASYIDFEVAFGTALVRRLAHVVCASFYFGATHVLLGGGLGGRTAQMQGHTLYSHRCRYMSMPHI